VSEKGDDFVSMEIVLAIRRLEVRAGADGLQGKVAEVSGKRRGRSLNLPARCASTGGRL
jgi:hypothetical protein